MELEVACPKCGAPLPALTAGVPWRCLSCGTTPPLPPPPPAAARAAPPLPSLHGLLPPPAVSPETPDTLLPPAGERASTNTPSKTTEVSGTARQQRFHGAGRRARRNLVLVAVCVIALLVAACVLLVFGPHAAS